MKYLVHKKTSNNIPYYFLDLKGTGTFNYSVIQNKGSSVERALHKIKNKNNLYGISHLIEHLSFKGCKDYSTSELSSLLKERGYHNAQTGYDSVKYFLKSISEYTDDVIKMINNISFNDMTRITKKEFETEKDIVISEANLVYENPQHVFHYKAGCKVFGMDDYDTIVGNPETLKNLTLEDIIETKKVFMTKDNLAFKIIYDSNDISPDEIIFKIEKSIESYMTDINKTDFVFNKTYKESLPNLEYNKNYEIESLKEYPQLLLAHYFDIPEEYNIILSDWVVDYLTYFSDTGLFENIREKEGLCYSINIYSGIEFDRNTYKIHTEIPKDKLDVYFNSLNKSLEDTLEDFFQIEYLRFYNITRMNEKINLLNLNSLSHILDKLIDTPEIFNKYEDLLRTKGIIEYTQQVQSDYLTYENMIKVLRTIKNSFKDNRTILVTN